MDFWSSSYDHLRSLFVQAFKRRSVQASTFKRSSTQAFKRQSVQAFKPFKRGQQTQDDPSRRFSGQQADFGIYRIPSCSWQITGWFWFFNLICFMMCFFKLNFYSNVCKLQHSLICLDLSLGSMLEVLVLKNAVECTSQRLKRTSGVRVMILLYLLLEAD